MTYLVQLKYKKIKITKLDSVNMRLIHVVIIKVSEGAKIRNRYNHVPHLIQDTDGKVTNSQLDTTNDSQEVS